MIYVRKQSGGCKKGTNIIGRLRCRPHTCSGRKARAIKMKIHLSTTLNQIGRDGTVPYPNIVWSCGVPNRPCFQLSGSTTPVDVETLEIAAMKLRSKLTL
jgi:hypothetical protein